MLREEKCFATEILHEHGLRLATIREELANTSARDVAQKSKAEEIVELRQRIHELEVELRATKARSLTPTEVDIVSSVAAGSSNKEIAQHLAINEDVVERHLSDIFGKLGVSTRLELALFTVNRKPPIQDVS